MPNKRQAIDARARQIVAESGVLWAVARDQAKAEDARARQIVDESGVSWAIAADQAKTEVATRSAHEPSSVEQHPASDEERDGGAIAFASRAGAVLSGLIAVGGTYLLLFGHVDICLSTAGWWFALVLVSPLVFIGLALLCAVVAPSDVETTVWLSLLTLAVVAYLLSLPWTLIGGGMASASC